MANTLKTPKVMPSEFCADGDKNTILTSPSTSNPQLANFSTGFPAIAQTPIPNGGIPPERADFNGMFNLLSSALVYIQNGGQWTFVPEVSNAIGGYPAGAILNYYDATHKVNKRVISNINNNVNNFLLDPSQIGDSSKPWSYTENTPIVQDLTNPSADTVPSTKAVSDESSRIGAIVGTKVNKSGDTMTGNLTINNGVPFYILQNNTKDLSKTFTDNKTDAFIIERDKNRKDGGFITFRHDIYDANVTELCASNGVDPNRKITSIGIWVKKNGEYGTFAPKCSINNSILTTVNNQLDAISLGNGLILNWGEITVGDNQTVPVVLKIPYSNTNYRVVFGHNNQAAGGTDFYHPQIVYTTKTTTGFSIYNRNAGSYHLSNVAWIAIGR